MDKEILEKIQAQEKKLNEILRSLERMRRFFFWKFIATVVVIMLPIIGVSFLIPKFLGNICENLGI